MLSARPVLRSAARSVAAVSRNLRVVCIKLLKYPSKGELID